MSDIERRRVLQALGAAGVGATVGPSIVRANDEDDPATPFCEGCPSGTDLLVKYDWDETDGFVHDGGACGDIVDFEVLDTNTDGEPVEVELTSDLLFEGLRVKSGNGTGDTACDSVPAEDVLSNLDEKAVEYTGTVSVDDPEIQQTETISYIAFCAAACFQVDFVFGDDLQDLGDDDQGFYGKRKLVHAYGNTYTERVSATQAGTREYDGCEVFTEQIDVEFGTDNQASVSFEVKEGDCELTLVSYVAPCPTVFNSEVADRQYHYEVNGDNVYQAGDEDTLSVGIPTVEHLDSICAPDGTT